MWREMRMSQPMLAFVHQEYTHTHIKIHAFHLSDMIFPIYHNFFSVCSIRSTECNFLRRLFVFLSDSIFMFNLTTTPQRMDEKELNERPCKNSVHIDVIFILFFCFLFFFSAAINCMRIVLLKMLLKNCHGQTHEQ